MLGAVERLVPRLRSDDRVSLVVFGRRAETPIAYRRGTEAFRLLEALDSVEPGGETNLGYGLRAACELADAGPADQEDFAGDVPPLVVLLSDGGSSLEPAALRRVEAALRSYVDQGMRLAVIDLSGQAEADPQLHRLAEAGGCNVLRAANTGQAASALVEAIEGPAAGGQVVARQATLSVTFYPEAVLGYRLLGHEMGTAEGAQPAPAASDVRLGQVATGLYELQLAPAAETIGEATLRWVDAEEGTAREEHRTLRRADFAAPWHDCPAPLAAAALAAETAEVLRGSYFAQGGSLRDVLEAARRLPPEVRERHRLPELLRLVEEADRLAGSGRRRGAP
jgi:hypothetical protein